LNYKLLYYFEAPVCKLYLLLISADAAQEKEKREESATAHWCFKVNSTKQLRGPTITTSLVV
jgi:hypothetical protein